MILSCINMLRLTNFWKNTVKRVWNFFKKMPPHFWGISIKIEIHIFLFQFFFYFNLWKVVSFFKAFWSIVLCYITVSTYYKPLPDKISSREQKDILEIRWKMSPSAPGLIFSRLFENLTIALKKFLFLRFWVSGPINVPFTTLDSR